MSPPPPLPYRDPPIDRSLLPPSASDCIASCISKADPEETKSGTVTSLMRHAVTKLREAIRQSIA